MQVHENMNMDTATRFSDDRKKSLKTIALIGSIFLFSLIATGLIVYNFASCPDPPIVSQCHGFNVNSRISSSNEITTTPDNGFTSAHTANLNDILSSAEIKTIALTTTVATATTTQTTLTPPTTVHTKTSDDLDLRLPRAIKPVSYNIKLIPYFEERNFTFDGYAQIVMNCHENTSNITLHAITLAINESDIAIYQLFETDDENVEYEVPIHNITFNEKKQFLIINLDEILVQNMTYAIYINYTGLLNDDLKGFYRSSYKHGDETR